MAQVNGHTTRHLYTPLTRDLLATLIIAATILLIYEGREIPDPWWVMATAVVSWLYRDPIRQQSPQTQNPPPPETVKIQGGKGGS